MLDDVWPSRPTVHDNDYRMRPPFRLAELGPVHWVLPPPYKTRPLNWDGKMEQRPRLHRTCSFCGSIHPGDLYEALMAGDVVLERNDSGEKVYVERIPVAPEWHNVEYISGYSSGGREGPARRDITYDKIGATEDGKFYLAHVYDLGYGLEAQAMLKRELSERLRVKFE